MSKPEHRHAATPRRLAALATAIVLHGACPSSHAETMAVRFDSLPGDQGWTYEGAPLTEEQAFATDGSRLYQRTVTSGENSFAGYSMAGSVDNDSEMSLRFSGAIIGYDALSIASTGLGFNFLIRDAISSYRLAMTDAAVFVNGQQYALDTTIRHDYVLDMHPGGTFELSIDGALAMTGASSGLVGDNRLFFGDSAPLENTDVEIVELSFTVSQAEPDIDVRKSVSNAFPMANEPLEFTVEVSNIGRAAAPGLRVLDPLPPAMTIPDGAAAFVSVGAYDTATGEWMVGDLGPGLGATLVVPAVVTATAPPDCIVNLAASNHPADSGFDNNEARAVVHQNGVERCIDLDVSFGISAGPAPLIVPECDAEDRYHGSVEVRNLASDAARGVIVSISQDPVVGPGLRFDDAACLNAPSSRCDIAEIAGGQMITVNVTSDPFRSYASYQQTLSVSATSSDPDYDPGNNNPVAAGTAGGFSRCAAPEIPLDAAPAGSACFIATAAYGSPLHPDIDALRAFRDRFMLGNGPGRAMVRFYYRHSPPLADYIRTRDWLRAVVRGALAPLVFAIKFPVWPASSLACLLVVAAAIRRRNARLLRDGGPAATGEARTAAHADGRRSM